MKFSGLLATAVAVMATLVAADECSDFCERLYTSCINNGLSQEYCTGYRGILQRSSHLTLSPL